MIKKLFIVLGLIVIIGFSFLLFNEFSHKKPIPSIIELPSKYQSDKNNNIQEPLASEQAPTTSQQINLSDSETAGEQQSQKDKNPTITPQLFLDDPIGFINIDYPNLYGYDYKNKSFRVFNIQNKTYKELYSNPNIDFISISPSKNLIAFRENNKKVSSLFLADLLKDKIYPLGVFIKNIYWNNANELIYYFSNDSTVNYIGKIKKSKTSATNFENTKITDVGALNPQFIYENNKLLIISESDSPLFLIDTLTNKTSVLLPKKQHISFLLFGNLIFASYINQEWKSLVLNYSGQILKEFNWGTFKEKCSVSNVLICGVDKNQTLSGLPNDWYELQKSFYDKLIMIDLKTMEEKEINIAGQFDILSPQLTPLGIIFTNRLDSKLYFIPTENLSL